ncbi:hypothetical protein [Streptomyces sp. UNOC14_S4]|uniref:hypothetical protein n=1 Tax=Streptomyces sp. UNOC14_S4 TaxID=2872340 RepID=UPI001E41E282|nr:hypothetical protein [Streptomyces sp. UNOC14_S4]MCC3767941.1 hypothetical protein [Streptomyces sp. UNOC14_S4]
MSTPAPIRILRGTDLLDLTFAFPGLKFQGGLGPRRLVRADPGQDALLVVTFGPQHVVEHAFDVLNHPEESRDLPVESLISGRSVLVFEVGPQDVVGYDEAGLLDAMGRLPLRVVDAAREPDTPHAVAVRPPGPPDGDLTAWATSLVRLLRVTAELGARFGPEAALAVAEAAGASVTGTGPGEAVAEGVTGGPQDPLADPAHPFTGIELPYRLYLSPSQKARWNHRGTLADPAPGDRVELWHTRSTGTTARAVWNRERAADPGAPSVFPQPMDGQDRSWIVDLTSGAGLTDPAGQPYTPLPIDVDKLMLSALGGWLDSSGEWRNRPVRNPLTQWRHRAALGRDHYVRIVKAGFLAPFGHRALFVQITERKFDDPRAAYLFQRKFIVIRQPLRTYNPNLALPGGPDGKSGVLTNALFPFTSVHIDTLVTPDLIGTKDNEAFFAITPAENPFRFKVTAVDHDGRTVEFRTPMQFVYDTLATPGTALNGVVSGYNSLDSRQFLAPGEVAPRAEVSAELFGQSVAFAPSAKPDDTRLDVAHLIWGMAAPPGLVAPNPDLADAPFLPQLRWANVSLPAVTQLAGRAATVPVAYADRYAESAFQQLAGRRPNTGEVFLSLLTDKSNTLTMNFNNNSDRSGGLVAPSFDVAGLSRRTGPVSGIGADALQRFADGQFKPDEFFHPSDALKLLGANLLGIVPLADIIKAAGVDEPLKVPQFFTETVNAVTGFLADLRRIRDQILSRTGQLPGAAQQVADTAQAFVKTVGDFLAQELGRKPGDPPGPLTMQDVDNAFNAFSTALNNLVGLLPANADPGLRALLARVQQQAATWTNAAGQVLSLRQAVEQAAKAAKLPETVNARFEWRPQIQSWTPPGLSGPVFVPDPDGSLSVVVDLRGSLRPDIASGADVTCTLEKFKLFLVPGVFRALELDFDRIRLTARAGKKLDVDVGFKGVHFIGPLSFVETLRQLIPLDGFSDPPGIQVTPSGITATYGLPLPNLAIGVFSLENLRLDASLDLPFVGRSMEARFSFCTRQAPFRLTVSLLGGGGFFGITLTPRRIAVLEAALEFGAALSMNFGVASGSLSVMAGIYYRLEIDTGESRLTGYFRARGEVDVLGIVSASIEICLELTWDQGTGTVFGRARISISIHIGFWSQSVTIECEKRFVGSGPTTFAALPDAPQPVRPPTFAEMMAPYPDPVTGEQRVPVDEYCTAFAEVS